MNPAASAGSYLVDLGKLVPVLATGARAAYTLAVLSVFGGETSAVPEHATVYHFDAEGEIDEVTQ
jgi:hypothetical protein